MGYALLYESMLDSVLVARDRFLRPKDQAVVAPGKPLGFKGVMVPSQCRMVLALCDPQGLIKQRVGFWRDVYGFDMSSMATEAFEEAIVEYIPKEEVLSPPCVVKVLTICSPHSTVHSPGHRILTFRPPLPKTSPSHPHLYSNPTNFQLHLLQR
jgi:protein arginine N-methyltransferase 3